MGGITQQNNHASLNVADFNVFPTNTAATNDTNIANAIAALPSSGPGTLLFPCTGNGIYLITQPIIVDKDHIALVAYGQRNTVTIQIDSSADPSYALIVGNTKTVNNCLIEGLTFQGRNSTSSTGGGINFRCNGGKIRQTRVEVFGGTGINVAAFSGTIFEVYMEDLDLIQNGMNTGTPGDNLFIASSASDCEYHRVISEGNSGKNTTHIGINNNGGQQKFIDCHAYNCSSDGLYSGGTGTQIIGGEYETNAGNGIESANPLAIIHGVACFGNTFNDIVLSDKATVTGCALTSTSVNIYSTSANGGVIADNMCSSATALYLDTGSSKFNVHDNTIAASSTAIYLKCTNSHIHDNDCTSTGTITEDTGANGNDIHDNHVPSAINLVGSTTRIRNNRGHNPVGQVTAPAFPATTVAATNNSGYDVEAYVANGTSAITVIQVAGVAGTYVTTGMQIAASGWGSVRIPAGGSIKFTYASGAPSWTWMGE